jgi:tripartite-type tricarboxylate transporter receptor subunit TctC
MEYLKLATGMFITHIPYRGTGPMLTDLLSGRVQASSAGLPALAAGAPQRLESLPNVPTVSESGPALGLGKSLDHFDTSQWYGIMVPAGTPKDIIKRLQQESVKALKSKSVSDLFAKEDTLIVGSTPEEFVKFILSEQKVWSGIVTKAKIKNA